jgi:hypothetical protein
MESNRVRIIATPFIQDNCGEDEDDDGIFVWDGVCGEKRGNRHPKMLWSVCDLFRSNVKDEPS